MPRSTLSNPESSFLLGGNNGITDVLMVTHSLSISLTPFVALRSSMTHSCKALYANSCSLRLFSLGSSAKNSGMVSKVPFPLESPFSPSALIGLAGRTSVPQDPGVPSKVPDAISGPGPLGVFRRIGHYNTEEESTYTRGKIFEHGPADRNCACQANQDLSSP